MRLALLVLFAGTAALAQPAFDVASVKPTKWTGNGSVGVFIRGNTLDAEHTDLYGLVEYAWNLQDFQLSGGPEWASAGHKMLSEATLFEVIAKAAPGETPSAEQIRLMLRTLLKDRFHLQIHQVSREFPAWNLVVSKGGPKLKDAAGGDRKLNTYSIGRFALRIEGRNISIPDAVENQIGLYARRPVFEKTGLTGKYDFTLEWLSDPTAPAGAPGSDLPTLETALQQQLGLRLEPTTAPFDTVVIDHAEKPTEN
ncbi:MAG TPA: TIGR03435 family protein [Bryobacteraceae bacterium]|nr:TIGR03435 family protein [Bryobacteraceae bacterium]